MHSTQPLATLADYLWVPAVLSPWCTFGPLIASAIKLVENQFKSDFLTAASLSARLDKLREHLQRGTFPAGVRKTFKSRSRRVSLLISIIESKESEYQSLLTRCTTSFVLATFGQQIIDQYLSLDSTPSTSELINISKAFAHLRYLIEWFPTRAKGSSIPESDLFNLLDGSTHDSVLFQNLRTFLVRRFFSLMDQAIPSDAFAACFTMKQKKTRLGSASLLGKGFRPTTHGSIVGRYNLRARIRQMPRRLTSQTSPYYRRDETHYPVVFTGAHTVRIVLQQHADISISDVVKYLGFGTKFIPKPTPNFKLLESSVQDFTRRIRLKEFFKDNENQSFDSRFHVPSRSNWQPPPCTDQNIEKGLRLLKANTFKLKYAPVNTSGLNSILPKPVTTFINNPDIIIKQADKNLGLTVLDKSCQQFRP
ncbi:hypothetical protein G6F52_011570 [Rhizopus delemar]|nr:hypothetical protein G6F52_011570 [Rhizopus delemar]